MMVEEIMDKNPLIVDPEEDLVNVLEKLKKRDACFVYKGVYYGGLTRFHILKRRVNLRETKAKTVAVPTPKIFPKDNISKVARLMIENNFYYLPVFDVDSLIGEVNFWIVLREFKEEGLKEIRVKDVMSSDLILIRDYETVGRAIGLMRKHKISNLPVVNEKGKLVGLVTAKDIIEKVISPRDRQKFGDLAGEKVIPLKTPVREIMELSFPTAQPDENLESVIDKVLNMKIPTAIVVKEGYPIGILTRKDILEVIIEKEEKVNNYQVTISSNFPVDKEEIMYFVDRLWRKTSRFLQWGYFFIYIKREGKASGFRYVVRIKLRSHVKTWSVKAEDYSYYLALKEAFEVLEENILEDKEEFLNRPEILEF